MNLNVVNRKVVELAVITPEQARTMLSKNSAKNRSIRKSWVNTLAYALETGNWTIPGNIDAIVFDDKGELINGQHRLSAIVQAGIPAPLYITFGVESDAYKYMDNGAKRVLADAITSENAKRVASIATVTNAIENGSAPIASALNLNMGGHARKSASIKMNLEYVEKNIDVLERCVKVAEKMRKATGGGSLATYGAFIKTMLWIEGDDQVFQFCDDFCSILPATKSVAFMKNAIMKRQGGKSYRERSWTFGILTQGYDAFKKEINTGIPTTAMNKSEQYLSRLNDVIMRKREEVRSKEERDGKNVQTA